MWFLIDMKRLNTTRRARLKTAKSWDCEKYNRWRHMSPRSTSTTISIEPRDGPPASSATFKRDKKKCTFSFDSMTGSIIVLNAELIFPSNNVIPLAPEIVYVILALSQWFAGWEAASVESGGDMEVCPFLLLRVRMASARPKVVSVRCLSAVAASDLSSLDALQKQQNREESKCIIYTCILMNYLIWL